MKKQIFADLPRDERIEGKTGLPRNARLEVQAGLLEYKEHVEQAGFTKSKGNPEQTDLAQNMQHAEQNVQSKKKHIRSEIKKRIRSMDDRDTRIASVVIAGKLLTLPEVQKVDTVFCYISIHGEVQTRSLIESLLNGGKKVCVPRCEKNGVMDACYISSLDDLIPQPPFGIPEPDMNAEVVDPAKIDFVIVPGLAFDRSGNRLGKGAGYYDRYLKMCRGVKCGVCFDEMLIDSVPTDIYDMPMDIIVTEKSILRIEKTEDSHA
jgi:5-formyltetrahydrofolate cyclo-ligase